ncbi:hypothetical protein AeRB84_019747 [Aphanomyces euteiches]|nr:hypothetical protein AeRB84_019747 [Aphanomyces euteiches]
MVEYWSEKRGMQRDSLASTDDVTKLPPMNCKRVENANEMDHDFEEKPTPQKRSKTLSEPNKEGAANKKSKTTADAIGEGLATVRDELVSLGKSLAPPPVNSAPPTAATLDDVLGAIQAQSTLMAQLIPAISEKK